MSHDLFLARQGLIERRDQMTAAITALDALIGEPAESIAPKKARRGPAKARHDKKVKRHLRNGRTDGRTDGRSKNRAVAQRGASLTSRRRSPAPTRSRRGMRPCSRGSRKAMPCLRS